MSDQRGDRLRRPSPARSTTSCASTRNCTVSNDNTVRYKRLALADGSPLGQPSVRPLSPTRSSSRASSRPTNTPNSPRPMAVFREVQPRRSRRRYHADGQPIDSQTSREPRERRFDAFVEPYNALWGSWRRTATCAPTQASPQGVAHRDVTQKPVNSYEYINLCPTQNRFSTHAERPG